MNTGDVIVRNRDGVVFRIRQIGDRREFISNERLVILETLDKTGIVVRPYDSITAQFSKHVEGAVREEQTQAKDTQDGQRNSENRSGGNTRTQAPHVARQATFINGRPRADRFTREDQDTKPVRRKGSGRKPDGPPVGGSGREDFEYYASTNAMRPTAREDGDRRRSERELSTDRTAADIPGHSGDQKVVPTPSKPISAETDFYASVLPKVQSSTC